MGSRLRVLVLDTETTGKGPDDVVIEIGAALYNTEARTIIASYATLLHAPANPAEFVNGISPLALCDPFALNKIAAITPICYMLGAAQAVIAHNSAFDQPLAEKAIAAAAGMTALPDDWKKPWICSMTRMVFPKYAGEYPGQKWRALSHVAVDHGVYPLGAHRAMTDVMMLCALLTLTPDLDEQLRQGMVPRRRYARYPPKPVEEPSKLGFKWNFDVKRWERDLTAEEAAALPFDVSLIEETTQTIAVAPPVTTEPKVASQETAQPIQPIQPIAPIAPIAPSPAKNPLNAFQKSGGK